ncbi:MAG: hypothetical protein V8R46_09100 [Eubacterium ramulus]
MGIDLCFAAADDGVFQTSVGWKMQGCFLLFPLCRGECQHGFYASGIV